MKLLISLILLILLILISCSNATKPDKITIADFQWEELANSPDSIANYYKDDDIYFVDDNTGWAISYKNGEVYQPIDGGNSWELQFKAPTPDGKYPARFRSISFLTKDIGYIGVIFGKEHGHIVYETRDGGSSWKPVAAIDNSGMEGVCSMSVVNENTIYMVGRYGGNGHIAKSTDQGKTWEISNVTDQIEMITDVYFWDENNGVILGGTRTGENLNRTESWASQYYSGAVILKTNDGRKTWQTKYTTDRIVEFAWKFSFPSENVGYASIESYRGFWLESEFTTEYFLKTTDKGETWTEMILADKKEDYFGQQGIGFITEKIGWIGSQDDDHGMKYTEDGGITWHDTGRRGAVNRFRFDNNKAYAIGHYIFKMDLPK